MLSTKLSNCSQKSVALCFHPNNTTKPGRALVIAAKNFHLANMFGPLSSDDKLISFPFLKHLLHSASWALHTLVSPPLLSAPSQYLLPFFLHCVHSLSHHFHSHGFMLLVHAIDYHIFPLLTWMSLPRPPGSGVHLLTYHLSSEV